MKLLKQAPPKKITLKHLAILSPLILFQLIIPVRPFALYLIEKVHIPFDLLSFFEIVTVPITLLIMSLFLIQKLNWSILKPKPFIIGFAAAVVFHFFFLIIGNLNFDDIFPLSEILSFFAFVYVPIFRNIPIIYSGWGWGADMVLQASMTVFIIIPLVAGSLCSLINHTYKKIQKVNS